MALTAQLPVNPPAGTHYNDIRFTKSFIKNPIALSTNQYVLWVPIYSDKDLRMHLLAQYQYANISFDKATFLVVEAEAMFICISYRK